MLGCTKAVGFFFLKEYQPLLGRETRALKAVHIIFPLVEDITILFLPFFISAEAIG